MAGIAIKKKKPPKKKKDDKKSAMKKEGEEKGGVYDSDTRKKIIGEGSAEGAANTIQRNRLRNRCYMDGGVWDDISDTCIK